MSTDVLLLALLASITVVAMMITLNTRGKWRATISTMLSACLLGGTIWLFTIQLSAIYKDDTQSERRRLNLSDIIQVKQEASPQQFIDLLNEACGLAAELERAKLYKSYPHEQLSAQANAVDANFEALLNDINDSKHALDKYPEAVKSVDEAMEELKVACHLFKTYYDSENPDGETAAERLMKQKARSAGGTLAKTIKTINGYERR